MKNPDRHLIRLANDIQDPLMALSRSQALRWVDSLRYPVEQLQQLVRFRHKLGLCQARQYHAAAKRLQTRLSRLLPDLISEIEGLQQMDRRRPVTVPSLRDLVGEIQQLQQEFDSYDYNRKSRTLSVTTDPITLEEIELGRFRIDLHLAALASLGSRDVYDIEALEPNPAATDSGITHPHVSHGRLCEGDASAPIRAALQEGRICDFFLLVRSVLQTYNSHSPYVSLTNWESQPCYDCGSHMNDDNRYYCESCENDLCDGCISYCRKCDRSICKGCLVECPHCQELYCERCMDACCECRQTCCPSCLEDDLCPTCKEEQEKENESHGQEQEEQSISVDGSPGGA
jgi:hypothetical protein